MTVVYPTAIFAKSAGFSSWAKAIEAMRAGQIVRGRGPSTGGKTTFDVQLFNQAVADAGMQMSYFDMGIVDVGLPRSLAEMEAADAARREFEKKCGDDAVRLMNLLQVLPITPADALAWYAEGGDGIRRLAAAVRGEPSFASMSVGMFAEVCHQWAPMQRRAIK